MQKKLIPALELFNCALELLIHALDLIMCAQIT